MNYHSNGATSLLARALYSLSKLIPFARKQKAVRLTIVTENLSFRNLLRQIERRTNYQFFCQEGIPQGARPLTMLFEEMTVEEILKMALAFQPESFTYSISGNAIFIERRANSWERPWEGWKIWQTTVSISTIVFELIMRKQINYQQFHGKEGLFYPGKRRFIIQRLWRISNYSNHID
jgi:hypothetical protein